MFTTYALSMKNDWHPFKSTVDVSVRLANQALRAQRILMGKRLLHMEEMIKIHGITLRKQPGGESKLIQIQKDFEKARQLILQGK